MQERLVQKNYAANPALDSSDRADEEVGDGLAIWRHLSLKTLVE